MAIRRYLAMTAAEMRTISVFPGEIAWMACHFSPYCLGISNLPRTLPPGSLLILDDITPIHGHDPQQIAGQLRERIDALRCSGLLLDFQRPDYEEAAALAKFLTQALPCPVAVSELYAADADCPVFLPPVPPSVPLEEYISPWKGREIWLEMALGGEVITLTPGGASTTPLPLEESCAGGHGDEVLHCHYHIAVEEEQARFTLFRTQDDLKKLLEEAEELGITNAVGLFQELHNITRSPSESGSAVHSFPP